MPGINLGAIREESWSLIQTNNKIKEKYQGSLINGLGIQQIILLTDISSRPEREIVKHLNEKKKRTLISFLKFFTLSESEDQSDIVDFLAEYCPFVLYEYCLINATNIKNHPLLDRNFNRLDGAIKQNSLSTITNRLNRLLDNEKFTAGLLTHLRSNILPERPQFLFDFAHLPKAIKDNYLSQNNTEQRKFLNANEKIGKIAKSVIVTLFGYGRIYKLLCGSTDPKIAEYLGNLKDPVNAPARNLDKTPPSSPRSGSPYMNTVLQTSSFQDDAGRSDSSSQGTSEDEGFNHDPMTRATTPPRPTNRGTKQSVVTSVVITASPALTPVKCPSNHSVKQVEPSPSPGGVSPPRRAAYEVAYQHRRIQVTIEEQQDDSVPVTPGPKT